MRLIELKLTRRQLAERLVTDGTPEGGLLLPANYDVALGEAVLVRVCPEELAVGTYLEGIVQWRRASASRGQPAGVGLRLVPASMPRWRYLRAWSSGEAVEHLRRTWRHPARQPVIFVTAPRGSTRIYPCSLAEVSTDGALLAINHRIEPGEEGRCEWAVSARTFAVTLRVVWSSPGRAGVRLLWRGRDERPAWDELVDSVRTALDAKLLAPRLDVQPAPSVQIRPETRKLTPTGDPAEARAVPRSDRGAVPERPIVELPPDPTRRRDPRRG